MEHCMYGSETWTVTQRDRELLSISDVCWRTVEGISWTQRKTNQKSDTVRQLTKAY